MLYLQATTAGFSLFLVGKDMTPFTLHAVLVYFQMDFGLLLYFKLARVVTGNVSKKGENMRSIITWIVFTRWYLCLVSLRHIAFNLFSINIILSYTKNWPTNWVYQIIILNYVVV